MIDDVSKFFFHPLVDKKIKVEILWSFIRCEGLFVSFHTTLLHHLIIHYHLFQLYIAETT